MKLTANSIVGVRLGESGSYTNFGTFPQGLGAWSLSDTKRTRPIPTLRGLHSVQLLDVGDASIGFTVDDNQHSAPLMFLRSGQVFSVQITIENTAGEQVVTMVGPARISHSQPEGGIRGYRFDLTATSVVYSEVS